MLNGKSSLHSFPYEKGKIANKKSTISQSSKSIKDDQFDEKVAKLRQERSIKTSGKVTEVTERPDAVSLIHDFIIFQLLS